MSRGKVLSIGSAVVMCVALSLNLALAQNKPVAKGKADDAPAKVKGRLPAYYKDIVDEKQKAQIYAIQADYSSKIAALKEQLEKLATDRDSAVENVLNPAQKARLKAAKEAAAAKKKKPEADKPEDGDKAAK
jgi:hypothetical protein